MGVVKSYICNNCNNEFVLQVSPNWIYNSRCNNCGKIIDSFNEEDLKHNCECSGIYQDFYNFFCPKCKSKDIKINNKGIVCFLN